MAVTPTTQCNQRVGGTVTFACSLEAGHDGPHYAYEYPPSVRARSRWAELNRYPSSPLAAFQGPAQTTAERYTENPTDVPQSTAVLREDAERAREERAQVPLPHPDPDRDPIDDFGTLVLEDQAQNLRVWRLNGGSYLASDWTRSTVKVIASLADALLAPNVEPPVAPGDEGPVDPDGDVQSLIIEDMTRRRASGQYVFRTPLAQYTLKSSARHLYETLLADVASARALLAIAEAEQSPVLDLAQMGDQVRLREVLFSALDERSGQETTISNIVDIVVGVLLGEQGRKEGPADAQ